MGGEGHATSSEPRVLVADDEADIREVVRLILEDEGYSVVDAEDGIETMDALALSPTPLIVLLDVLMPLLSGYEVLLRVAADPALRSRHAYCVLTAAQLTAEQIGPRFATLVTDLDLAVMPKPFDLDELLACTASLRAKLRSRATTDKHNAGAGNPAGGGEVSA
jgi:CheY-like chemotaxis protein